MEKENFIRNKIDSFAKTANAGLYTFSSLNFNGFHFIKNLDNSLDLANQISYALKDSQNNEYLYIDIRNNLIHIQSENKVFNLFKEISSDGSEKTLHYYRIPSKKMSEKSVQDQMTEALRKIA